MIVSIQSLDVGNLAADGNEKIVQICANRCVLSGNECDAFYVKDNPDDGTECHLVLETPQNNRTIGHGKDREDVYYVKMALGEDLDIPRPQKLEPPCDTDTNELSESECAEFPADNVLTYHTCTDVQNTYIGTATIISDTKCPGEDRILQCELEDGKADSNIAENTRFSVLNHAFLKTYIDENVSRPIES